MTDLHPILKDIDAFLETHPMSDYTFGIKVCKNGRLLERLRAGGDLPSRTVTKIEQWLSDNSEAA